MNKDVYDLHNISQSNIQSKPVTYKSVETVVEADEAVSYLTEFWIPSIRQGFHRTYSQSFAMARGMQ